MSGVEPITAILVAHRDGEPGAFNRLVGAVYPELRRLARRQLAWRAGHSLETGGLVNEVYLKMIDQTKADWRDRNHFFAIAARAMRQVVIDYARRKKSQKRGGERQRVGLDARELAVEAHADRLLLLDQLLSGLEREEPRLLQIVECRFFAGYTETETAEALGISSRTVQRDWLRAKAWLRQAMEQAPGGRGPAAA